MSTNSGPALILTPEGRDAEIASAILQEVQIPSRACRDLPELVGGLPEACCAVIAEEALLRADRQVLAAWIGSQPPWSDFPFVLLTFRGGGPDPRLTELLGNVTVLERPFHPSVLVNAVRSAARARQRQHEAELYLYERRRIERHREILMRELHHRAKNTLASVNALIRAPAKSARTIEDFREILSARLLSLSRTHDLLLDGEWQAVFLYDLLRGELDPYDGDGAGRIILDGEAVELTSDAAMTVGMIVHELATNAAKYGSLSVARGRLAVEWSVRPGPERELSLAWRELDGPPVRTPAAQGFGTKLIQRMLIGLRGAHCSFDYKPAGLEFRLRLVLAAATAVPDPVPPEPVAFDERH